MRLPTYALCSPRLLISFAHTAFAASWDPLTVLTVDPFAPEMTQPIFDPSGNAWVAITDSTGTHVFVSNGTSGAWQPPVNQPAEELAIAPSGVVHAVYAVAKPGGAGYLLEWARYIPGSGWQPPTMIYDIPQQYQGAYQRTHLATDASGNLIVNFNIGNQAWAIVYAAASGTWGSAVQLTPTGASVFDSTLKQNAGGSSVMLVYLLQNGSKKSLYSQLFSSSARAFESPVAVGGTSLTDSTSDPESYPMTIDSSGNATLIVPYKSAFTTSIFGVRYEGGKWQSPVQLLPWTTGLILVPAASGAAVNGSGIFLGATTITTNSRGNNRTNLQAFRFTPGQGWSTEMVLQVNTNSLGPVRTAWVGSGQAVLTYDDPQKGLSDLLSSGSGWVAGPPIPTGQPANPQELTSAPTGEVLLVFGQYVPNFSNETAATWLRP